MGSNLPSFGVERSTEVPPPTPPSSPTDIVQMLLGLLGVLPGPVGAVAGVAEPLTPAVMENRMPRGGEVGSATLSGLLGTLGFLAPVARGLPRIRNLIPPPQKAHVVDPTSILNEFLQGLEKQSLGGGVLPRTINDVLVRGLPKGGKTGLFNEGLFHPDSGNVMVRPTPRGLAQLFYRTDPPSTLAHEIGHSATKTAFDLGKIHDPNQNRNMTMYLKSLQRDEPFADEMMLYLLGKGKSNRVTDILQQLTEWAAYHPEGLR